MWMRASARMYGRRPDQRWILRKDVPSGHGRPKGRPHMITRLTRPSIIAIAATGAVLPYLRVLK